MSTEYRAVQWNRQKRLYDEVLIGGIVCLLAAFSVLTKLLFPLITDEILLIRATAATAFVLLHFILCIGPLCRLNRSFLPLLYNRRHAGVAMCVVALAHAALVIITYHAGGNVNPLRSIFAENSLSHSSHILPFQPFGFFALLLLVLMAATSHDFWLVQLTAPVWKALHMMVYAAYGLLVLHVTFGVLQSELHWVYGWVVVAGAAIVLTFHGVAGLKERANDEPLLSALDDQGFEDVCSVDEIPPNRAKIVCLSGERVAIFKYGDQISAVSNLCQHQNGPLGEGKIVNGCITCPWHGYQYIPETGASPAPFVEKLPTFRVRIRNGRVLLDPKPNLPGTRSEPARIACGASCSSETEAEATP